MSGFPGTKRLLAGLVIAAAGGWAGGAAPASVSDRVVTEISAGSRSYSFSFKAPAVQVRMGTDGFADVTVDGFRTLETRPGVPDLPHRALLMAIPPGATPRLVFTTGGETATAVRPRPVPERRELAPGLGVSTLTSRPAPVLDSEVYAARALYPERAVWLGEIGVLRDQRYVEVHLAPVRYDGSTGGLVSHESIEVTVYFDGALPTTGTADDHRVFESIYRTSFVNYEQGRRFRLQSAIGELEPEEGDGDDAVPSGGPATPRQRILIRSDGIVRIPYTALQPAGFHLHPLSRFRLTGRGVSVPLQFGGGDVDDTLESGEWIQFYGEVLDHEPETVLQTAPDLFAVADFTDENTYFLDIAASAQPAMTAKAAAPICGGCGTPSSFDALQHLETDETYRPLGGADPWYWGNSFTAPATRAPVQVPLPGLNSATAPVDVRVQLRGITPTLEGQDCANPDHLTEVRLLDCPAGNCSSGQTVLESDPGSFDGRTIHLHDFTWTYPGSGPGMTATAEIEIQALTLPVGGCPNSVILDYVELGYKRSFTAIGEKIVFDWPDENKEFVITGWADPAPAVYEITTPPGGGPAVAARLTGGVVTSGSLHFRIDDDPGLANGTLRRFLVAGSSAVATLPGDDFIADEVSDLKLSSNQAEYVVILHPDTVSDASNCPGTGCAVLTDLLEHRDSPAGGNLNAKVALIQDVYDEFNDGLPGPQAIRNFLAWVMGPSGWSAPKPTFVLLVGDGTTDYKHGKVEGNYVPTQIMFRDRAELGYYASDNLLAAVVGSDSMPDLVIGRMPARTPAEADVMLQKTLDYELSPPAGAWRGNLLFISDRGHTGSELAESLEFEALNDASDAHVGGGYTSTHLRYYPDYYVPAGNNGQAAGDAISADIKAAINNPTGGRAIVQFIGHGHWLQWSDDAFMEALHPAPYDMDDLTNGLRLPWLMAHNCLTGGFHYTYAYSFCNGSPIGNCSPGGQICDEDADCNPADRTIGEDALRRPGGGAVSVFAPTGLSFNYISQDAVEFIWEPVFGDRKERDVAIPVMETLLGLCTAGRTEACQNYAQLGDPALRLALPDIGPATALLATGGHQHVDLTWTASTTGGSQYDVYRKNLSTFELNYTKIAGPISGSCAPGCSYANTGLTNAQTYSYYVVAVGPGGFESAVSNTDDATPLNPNAPAAPTGVAVSDPGTGSHLDVSWFANAEADITSYTIDYRSAPGPYTGSLTVPGNLTSARLQGLVAGTTYWVAVKATNTSSLTSLHSAEASDFPVFGPGLHLPNFIGNLRLRLQGTNVILEWGAVTTDIYGKPLGPVTYQIYRGTSPTSLTFLGPSATPSYTDVGARNAPSNYHYWVRAVDAGGGGGGLGAEFPGLILTLDVEPSQITPGGVRLSWDPVTTTLDQTRLALAYYAVYVGAAPFSRQDIEDGQLPAPIHVTSGTFLELPPPPGNQYYSVLAVDIRGNESPF